MWKCSYCEADIEEEYVVCWNCGTSADGVRDPTFVAEEDVAERPGDWMENVHCQACGYRGKSFLIHAGYRGWVPRLVATSDWHVACPQCGSRDGLQDWRGPHTANAEAIWNSARLSEQQKYRANQRSALIMALLLIAVATALLFVTFAL